MIDVEPYIKTNWATLVRDAKEQLEGNCPLLEDEVIATIDKYIGELESFYYAQRSRERR
jgi:hypothetical protein